MTNNDNNNDFTTGAAVRAAYHIAHHMHSMSRKQGRRVGACRRAEGVQVEMKRVVLAGSVSFQTSEQARVRGRHDRRTSACSDVSRLAGALGYGEVGVESPGTLL